MIVIKGKSAIVGNGSFSIEAIEGKKREELEKAFPKAHKSYIDAILKYLPKALRDHRATEKKAAVVAESAESAAKAKADREAKAKKKLDNSGR